MNYAVNEFSKNFIWGVSNAAYQVEGAWNESGKGKSIWDVFSQTKGKVAGNQNGNVACDFYHRYVEDIGLIHELKIPNFRFSISWSRIIPGGTNQVNQFGIDFYNRVINLCLENGIVPWITLYHWDLPYELEKRGGWTNREIIGWFTEYIEVCLKNFGDRVKNWIILNEPLVFTGVGYFLGMHAPGRKGLTNFLSAAHHAALCQADGGRIVRSFLSDAFIGTTFSCSSIHPLTGSERNLLAANRIDALLNRMFVEPLAGLGYPFQDLKFLNRLEPFIKDGDEKLLEFEMDFIGIQNYTREIVKSSMYMPLIGAKIVKAEKRNVETTEMGWEVYPESIFEMLLQFSKYKKFKNIIVTENGAAFPDAPSNGQVNDEKRKSFLEQNIRQVIRARDAGVNVKGYFIWSLTDNFEWAEGFRPRFGLVYLDYLTQKRIIKSSGYWYSRLIQKTEP